MLLVNYLKLKKLNNGEFLCKFQKQLVDFKEKNLDKLIIGNVLGEDIIKNVAIVGFYLAVKKKDIL